jgi:hypothetical protein
VRNLLKRLNSLEAASGIDQSGCAPHSPAWLAYWKWQWERYVADEPSVRFTIEAIRAIMRDIDDDAE